jgi:hypothetical protein
VAVMSHSFDQHKFCAGNGFSRRTAAHVAHAVSDAVDQQGRDREMSQAFGPIARSDRRDRLARDADRIMGALRDAACLRGDITLVVRICGRTDRAEGESVTA